MDNLPQKAISIRQPWAWAILHARKDIENRSWATSYRGPVCIHASKGMTNRELGEAMDFIDKVFPRDPVKANWRRLSANSAAETKRGGIVGVVDIVDCVEESDSPWFFGRYGFVLRNARPVSFIPVKGFLGLFDWQHHVKASEVRANG